MITKTKIALAAVLFSAIASPSFASSQDLAGVQENSGRILGTQIAMPHAYASAVRGGVMHVWTHGNQDFQLYGRGL
jgi:hypothetical protein